MRVFHWVKLSVVCVIFLMTQYAHAEFFIDNGKAQETSKTQLRELQKQIRTVQTELAAQNKKLAAWEKEVSALDMRIADNAQEIEKTTQAISTQQQALITLTDKQTRMHEQILHQRAQLMAQMKTAYYLGPKPGLKLLLGENKPHEINRMMTYYDYFNRARLDIIESLKLSVSELSDLEKTISEKTYALAQLQTSLKDKEQRLLTQRKARATLLEDSQQKVATQTEILSQLQKDEAHLTDVLAKFNQDKSYFGYDKPFSQKKRQLVKPVAGKITKHFGDALGADLKWKGVLMRSNEGQPVYSVAAGRVVYSGWLRGYGLLMIVHHGEGYLSLYGRNQSLYKQTGDQVFEGEMIAQVGLSGGFEKSGLYFELRHDGQPIDPEKWFSREERA